MPNERHWCATFFKSPNHGLFKGRYAIIGEEICPTTGKTHWQAYLEFKEKVSMKYIKEMFGDKSIHLEKRHGTREQARDYCKKEGKFNEYGVWSTGPGFRTDLVSVSNQIFSGEKRVTEIMAEEPTLYCKYRNGLRDIQAEADKKLAKDFRKVEVIVLSGPTGCGKTREAMKEATYKIEGENLKWWNGYEGEECILIDEYDNDVKITKLLNLLDGYQLRLDVKGGHTYARWSKVYITTNLRIDELHAQAKEAHRTALFRRISEWRDFWNPGKWSGVVQGNTEPALPLRANQKKYNDIDGTPHGSPQRIGAPIVPGGTAPSAPTALLSPGEGALHGMEDIDALAKRIGLVVHE